MADNFCKAYLHTSPPLTPQVPRPKKIRTVQCPTKLNLPIKTKPVKPGADVTVPVYVSFVKKYGWPRN